jgi:uncharacterized protein
VSSRVAGALIGVVFGVTLVWSGLADPAVIREGLLFQDAYLFLLFGSAVLVATVGQAVLRRWQSRAAITGAPLTWSRPRVARRHVVGSLLFGVGWGIAHACPGPVAAQVGQGVPWALFTAVGLVGGVWLFLRQGNVETEPAVASAGEAVLARPG